MPEEMPRQQLDAGEIDPNNLGGNMPAQQMQQQKWLNSGEMVQCPECFK